LTSRQAPVPASALCMTAEDLTVSEWMPEASVEHRRQREGELLENGWRREMEQSERGKGWARGGLSLGSRSAVRNAAQHDARTVGRVQGRKEASRRFDLCGWP